MAKSVHFGIGAKARKGRKMYFGVGGKARKVKKAYVGIEIGRASCRERV